MVAGVMHHLSVLSCVLATASTCVASPGRSLQQGAPQHCDEHTHAPLHFWSHNRSSIHREPSLSPAARAEVKPFWFQERRISNESATYSTSIVPRSIDTFTASEFGGCTGPLCPTATDLIAFRLCFASRDATITLTTTLGRRSVYDDSQLYVFSVEGDAPPFRDESIPANAWNPSYPEFFRSRVLIEQHFDDNSGAMCSPDGNITQNVCAGPASGCTPVPFGIQCPPGTAPRLLSKLDFQLTHGYGRPYKCMYAVIGAKEAPTGTDKLEFGLDVEISAPLLLPGCTPFTCTLLRSDLHDPALPCGPLVVALLGRRLPGPSPMHRIEDLPEPVLGAPPHISLRISRPSTGLQHGARPPRQLATAVTRAVALQLPRATHVSAHSTCLISASALCRRRRPPSHS